MRYKPLPALLGSLLVFQTMASPAMEGLVIERTLEEEEKVKSIKRCMEDRARGQDYTELYEFSVSWSQPPRSLAGDYAEKYLGECAEEAGLSQFQSLEMFSYNDLHGPGGIFPANVETIIGRDKRLQVLDMQWKAHPNGTPLDESVGKFSENIAQCVIKETEQTLAARNVTYEGNDPDTRYSMANDYAGWVAKLNVGFCLAQNRNGENELREVAKHLPDNALIDRRIVTIILSQESATSARVRSRLLQFPSL